MIAPDHRAESSESDDRSTGLPGLRTWPAVYVFVFSVFVAWVVLLTLLSHWFA